MGGADKGSSSHAIALADLFVDELWHDDVLSTASPAPIGRRAGLMAIQGCHSDHRAVGLELLARAGTASRRGLDHLVDELCNSAARHDNVAHLASVKPASPFADQ